MAEKRIKLQHNYHSQILQENFQSLYPLIIIRELSGYAEATLIKKKKTTMK